MFYMFKVFIVVAVPVFGVAGAVLLGLIAWEEVKQYTRARRAIQRISAVASRERLAISRIDSRNRETGSLRVA